ncbi:hypothetical protein ABPG74_008705 [Tetrahymena malaccensis]
MSQSNSASSAKKSQVIGKNFISKNEILAWINDLLKVNMTLIEQLGSGTMYCQLLDVIYPGQVPLSKVKWTAKLEYDFLHNFKILQQTFDKLQVPKMIPVNKLAKAKYQDNLEFAQWIKAYFDINCKEKGRGYDALKRRGNVVPYFGFCKGGVLPKQTLFFRNPNEKLTLDDFSSSSFSSQHEPEFPESESYSSNNNIQGLFKSESTPLKQSSFFSNNSPQNSSSSAQIKQQSFSTNIQKQSVSLNQANSSFFQRGEQQQSITPKNSFFESNNSNKEFSQFFGKSEGQKIQDNNCSFFQKEKQQIDHNDQLQNKFTANKYGNQGSNFFSSDQNNQSTSIIESSFFSKQRALNSNLQSNQNNFFNERSSDATSNNYSNKLSCDKSYEKKTPSLSTSNLLSKFQQLTEVSQILLKKNSEMSEKSNSNILQKPQQYEDKSPSNQNLQITTEVNLGFQSDLFFKKDNSQNISNQQQQESEKLQTIKHEQNCQPEEKSFQDSFFKGDQEQKSQNNIFSNNENNILVKEKSNQINQSNNFSQQSDSQESNILYGNICSQESASNQLYEGYQKQEFPNNISKDPFQAQQNKTEGLSSFGKQQDKKNHIQNSLEDLDSQNSYETPICKKQKKNEESENFSKDSEKYNQTTVQINNREDFDQIQQSENNFAKNPSNKDKVLQIFQIIQMCQQDYDSAMKQILNVIQNDKNQIVTQLY